MDIEYNNIQFEPADRDIDNNYIRTCCTCYWNDQCCSGGCNMEQEDCDDYTPIFIDEIDRLNYIEKFEYNEDLKDRINEYDELIREMGGFDDYE